MKFMQVLNCQLLELESWRLHLWLVGHTQRVVILLSSNPVQPLGFVIAIGQSLIVVVVVVVVVHFVAVVVLIVIMLLHLIQRKLNHLHSVVLIILPVKHHLRMMHRLMVAYL